MAIAGFTSTCGKNQGGGSKIYITNAADVDTMTLGSSVESYETITMETSKVFFEYSFEQDTAQFTSNTEATSNGAFSVTNEVIFDMGRWSQEARDAIQELLTTNDCGYIVIFVDNNSTQWVFGYDQLDLKARPMRVVTKAVDGKTTYAEAQESIITMQSIQREEPRTFTGTVPTT